MTMITVLAVRAVINRVTDHSIKPVGFFRSRMIESTQVDEALKEGATGK